MTDEELKTFLETADKNLTWLMEEEQRILREGTPEEREKLRIRLEIEDLTR